MAWRVCFVSIHTLYTIHCVLVRLLYIHTFFVLLLWVSAKLDSRLILIFSTSFHLAHIWSLLAAQRPLLCIDADYSWVHTLVLFMLISDHDDQDYLIAILHFYAQHYFLQHVKSFGSLAWSLACTLNASIHNVMMFFDDRSCSLQLVSTAADFHVVVMVLWLFRLMNFNTRNRLVGHWEIDNIRRINLNRATDSALYLNKKKTDRKQIKNCFTFLQSFAPNLVLEWRA